MTGQGHLQGSGRERQGPARRITCSFCLQHDLACGGHGLRSGLGEDLRNRVGVRGELFEWDFNWCLRG